MNPITFYVPGEPKGQPRPKAFARNFGGKWMARVYDAGTAENWKSQIAIAAKQFIPAEPLTGPLRVDLTFYFPRPKGHYRSGKNAHQLKDGAPTYHTSKPDRDNSEKAVTDALTILGMWVDDSQICAGEVRKLYTDGHRPGCQVDIAQIADRPVTRTVKQEGELTLV